MENHNLFNTKKHNINTIIFKKGKIPMEALYGYMSESELKNSIMEKEFDIETKRLFLESEYMVETEDISKKQNVFQKMIESIQKFIQKILDSMSDFMNKMKEKKVESKLKDAPSVKMDYDPIKELNEIEKKQTSILNKLKHPGLIKKDETGTHLTSRGKIAVGAGITVGAVTLFDVYRRINKLQRDTSYELNDLRQKLYNHETYDEINACDIYRHIGKVSKESRGIKDQIGELQKNIKEANNLRQDLERRIMSLSNDTYGLQRDINSATSNDMINVLKKRYPQLNDNQFRELKKRINDDIYNGGLYSKSFLTKKANEYVKDILANVK